MAILAGLVGLALIIVGAVLIYLGRRQPQSRGKVIAGIVSIVIGLCLVCSGCGGGSSFCGASAPTGGTANLSAAFTGNSDVVAKPKPPKPGKKSDFDFCD